jgi:hypothetical protein
MEVENKYVKNELSHQPGGVTVMVEYTNGHIKPFPNIKYGNAYIKKIIKKSNIKRAYIKE